MAKGVTFVRSITVSSEFLNDRVVARGKLVDSYHELEAEVWFSFPDLVIEKLNCRLTKHPHEECQDYKKHIEKLKGVRVGRKFFSSLIEKTGFPLGCAHMNNLIYEMGMAAVQARFARWDELAPLDIENIPKDKLIKMYLEGMPGMVDACSAWASDSAMVKRAKACKD